MKGVTFDEHRAVKVPFNMMTNWPTFDPCRFVSG